MYAGPEIQGTLTRDVGEYVGPEIQDHPSFGSRLMAQYFLGQVLAQDFLVQDVFASRVLPRDVIASKSQETARKI